MPMLDERVGAGQGSRRARRHEVETSPEDIGKTGAATADEGRLHGLFRCFGGLKRPARTGPRRGRRSTGMKYASRRQKRNKEIKSPFTVKGAATTHAAGHAAPRRRCLRQARTSGEQGRRQDLDEGERQRRTRGADRRAADTGLAGRRFRCALRARQNPPLGRRRRDVAHRVLELRSLRVRGGAEEEIACGRVPAKRARGRLSFPNARAGSIHRSGTGAPCR